MVISNLIKRRYGSLYCGLRQQAIYGVVWYPENDFLCTAARIVLPLYLPPRNKPLTWKTQDEIVLRCDWNPGNHIMVPCSGDCKYRVWDQYRRQIYCSNAYDHVIASIKWVLIGITSQRDRSRCSGFAKNQEVLFFPQFKLWFTHQAFGAIIVRLWRCWLRLFSLLWLYREPSDLVASHWSCSWRR
jgi:hypothetical protein